MKQNYTMYIYKADRRCKTGERLFSTTVWTDRDDETMRRECNDLYDLYPATKGWRFECHPTTITVKSYKTGEDVQIDRDTPWSCNPASESFWSM
jgi:hypothetical protein